MRKNSLLICALFCLGAITGKAQCPVIMASVTNNVTCNGDTTGLAKVSVTGSATPFTYSWSPNTSTTYLATGLSAGTYTVTVTNNIGCSVSASVTVTQPSAIRDSVASIAYPNCMQSGSVTIGVKGGTSPYTYIWSPNVSTTASAAGLTVRGYIVEVKDSSGCTSEVAFNITQPGPLVASASVANVSCFGGLGSATAVVTGGTVVVNNFSVEKAIQHDTIPAGIGTVTITVVGAAGGGSSTVSGLDGGNGASFSGACSVTPGHILSVVVGSKGGLDVDDNGGGGGGATWVYDSNEVASLGAANAVVSGYLYAAAAGGGGSGYFENNGANGGLNLITNATTPGAGGSGVGGTGGNGGSTSSFDGGAAGAGFLSNGESITGVDTTTGGDDQANGFNLVTGYDGSDHGGFGGGGGGGFDGGGGGGGYNGGGGGGPDDDAGGGGGSYLSGTRLSTPLDTNTGTGFASIAYSLPGGTSPYTYSWSNGQTTVTAIGLSAGTYSLTVTDINGCTSSASVTVTQPAVLGGLSLPAYSTINCFGTLGNATAIGPVGGTSPYVYSWSPNGGSGATGTGLSTGTYTLTVKDVHGCTTTASTTVTQPATPIGGVTITGFTNASCLGGIGNATASAATGGTPPYTYSWSGGAGTTLSANISAGTYTLTATDNLGCLTMASVTITQPSLSLIASTSAATNVNCYGGATGSVSAILVSPVTVNFSYVGAVQNLTLPAGVTTVTVSVTGARGGYNFGTTTGAGAGASFTGVCAVTPGDILSVAVGGIGNQSTEAVASGGGGGTFVYDSNTVTPLAIAGGGGSGAYSFFAGAPADSDLVTNAASNSSSGNGLDGTGGNGGAAGTPGEFAGGGGGAGWFSNGGNSNSGFDMTLGGSDEALPGHFAGGGSTSSYDGNSGGFGGGGEGAYDGGGGGGGYNGGGGGNAGSLGEGDAGGGGGSYFINNLSLPLPTATSTNIGYGYASITYLAPGGTAPYTYSWSNGQTDSTATGLSAGTYTLTVTDNHGCTATASSIVTQLPPVGITISAVSNATCLGSTGTATANPATGGSSPYTYSWSSGGGTNLASTPLSSGTYTITAVDNNGCSASAITTISQPALSVGITISSVTNVQCYGGTGSATANAATGGTSPYTYTWSGGAGNNLTAIVTAGTYTVTVTDNHGCTGTASATVTQSASPLGITISSVANALCNGGTGSITANQATGGASPYVYLWSPSGGTNLTATVSAGTYTVIVFDNNGCTASASASISQPAATIGITLSSVTDVVCNGGTTGSLIANGASGGVSPYVYSWSPSGGTRLIAIDLSAGTYTITATDSHNCSATASATVTQPPPMGVTIASLNNISCHGGTGSITANAATGDTSPYTYRWSPDGGTDLIASNLGAGSYTITVTDAHGCTSTAGAVITQPASALDISIASHTNVSCHGGSGDATANTASGGTLPYTYEWTPAGGTNVNASNLSAGTYTIIAYDNHGCVSTASVTITQPALLPGISISSQTNVTCNGEDDGKVIARSATGGTAPYTYNWVPSGGTNLTASNLSAGTYTITATDNHGCITTASVVITQPAEALVIKTDSINQSNSPCNGVATVSVLRGGTAPYTYRWTTGGQTTTSISNQCAGTYCCVVEDNHGCSQSVCVTIKNATAIENISNSSAINVYPNPNNGQFTITGIENGMMIEVYDYTGRRISVISANSETMKLNISTESNGVYLIRILSKDGVLLNQKKIVKTE